MGRGAQGTAGPFNNDYLKENLPQLHFTYILSDTVQFLFSTNEGQDWNMVFDAFLIFLHSIFHVFLKLLCYCISFISHGHRFIAAVEDFLDRPSSCRDLREA